MLYGQEFHDKKRYRAENVENLLIRYLSRINGVSLLNEKKRFKDPGKTIGIIYLWKKRNTNDIRYYKPSILSKLPDTLIYMDHKFYVGEKIKIVQQGTRDRYVGSLVYSESLVPVPMILLSDSPSTHDYLFCYIKSYIIFQIRFYHIIVMACCTMKIVASFIIRTIIIRIRIFYYACII